MSRATPGPWRVGSKYPTDVYAARAGHAIARAVNPQHEGECEANATLIAAAPELLAALIALDNYVCNNLSSDSPTGIDVNDKTFEAARAAISKAQGRTA